VLVWIVPPCSSQKGVEFFRRRIRLSLPCLFTYHIIFLFLQSNMEVKHINLSETKQGKHFDPMVAVPSFCGKI